MAVRKIIRMGHPTLRKPARDLTAEEIRSPEIAKLVEDMVDTLRDYGGIGLAAPQIDEPIRLAIIEIPGGESRYGELAGMPLNVFANPEIEILDESIAGYWEGCLSVPGLRGFVERPQRIRVRATDLQGAQIELTLEGFTATVFQHEFDHLDGRLYVDLIRDPHKLVFEEEFTRYGEPD